MDTLIELINIVNRKRLSKKDLLDNTLQLNGGDKLYYKLYDAILNKKVDNDTDATMFIYGVPFEDSKYRMLKSRLKDKLKNTILFLDSDVVFTKNPQTTTYYNSLKNLIIVEILIKLNGTGKVAFEIIQDDYLNAQRYNFYDILKRYSFHKLNYFSFKGELKGYSRELINYRKYVEYDNKEQESKFLFWKILLSYTSNKKITDDFLKQFLTEIYTYRDLVFFLNQNDAIYLYYYLMLLYYDLNGDPSFLNEICDKLDELINNFPEIDSNTKRYLILYYRMKSSLC